ncbi:MAG TPA: hypothetical protein VNJ54_09320 [Plantibacter sp.]|uniref:hypothetical protein n=1 Tax=unclassified Plantibacter TaxID=2624265 RepID=UPI002C384A7D|nr:hypothetical protein [Plantibacter sp.]
MRPTNTLEDAVAAPAILGSSSPSAASGMAATPIPVGRFDPQFPFADAPVTEAPYPPLNYTRPARR